MGREEIKIAQREIRREGGRRKLSGFQEPFPQVPLRQALWFNLPWSLTDSMPLAQEQPPPFLLVSLQLSVLPLHAILHTAARGSLFI